MAGDSFVEESDAVFILGSQAKGHWFKPNRFEQQRSNSVIARFVGRLLFDLCIGPFQ
jgi:hypothetical protein